MIGGKSCMFNIEKKTSVGQKLIYEDKFENVPGCLWSAQDMRNILPAAIGEWINSSSEFSSYLVKKKKKTPAGKNGWSPF